MAEKNKEITVSWMTTEDFTEFKGDLDHKPPKTYGNVYQTTPDGFLMDLNWLLKPEIKGEGVRLTKKELTGDTHIDLSLNDYKLILRRLNEVSNQKLRNL